MFSTIAGQGPEAYTNYMAKHYDEEDVQRFIHFAAEQFKEEFKPYFESIDYISEQVREIPQMRADISELKTDMKTVKAAITATNKDVQWLKRVAHAH